MARISDVTLPNGTSYDIGQTTGAEFIRGTQSSATGTWTGVTTDPELYDGKEILYFLPVAGSGNATLNLTLKGGGTSGAKNCYFSSTTRLTTHYGANSMIRMTYHKSLNIGGTNYEGWWTEPGRDTNTTYTAASADPLMDGTAAVGTSAKYAREDHVHPSDTSRVPTSRKINNKALSSDITLSASDVSAIATSAKGVASGVAELDSNGKVPSSQLPSYVDDVLEYSAKASFPATGEAGKIYVDTSTNLTWRWSGSTYVQIASSLALGETSSTAYRGDRGASAYAHAVTNKGSAFSSGLYKITTNSEGHVTAATAVVKDDITGLGIPASDTNTHYTTHLVTGASASATANAAATNGNVYLNVLDDSTVRNAHNIVGTGSVTVESDANGKITINGTDNNTDTKVTQTIASDNSNYRVLFSATADNTTRTEGAKKDGDFYYNPSTNVLTAGTFNGAIAPSKVASGNDATSGGLDLITASYIPTAASNKSFGLPAAAITVEYSTNSGSTWTSYGATDAQKINLFNESRGTNFYLGKASTAASNNVANQLRVTIEPTDRYCSFHGIYLWFNTQGNTAVMDLERSTIGAKDTFNTVFTGQAIAGWSGNNIRYFSQGTFGGGSTQTSNTYKYRITFRQTAINANYASAIITDIRFLGYNVWTVPNSSTYAGNMVREGTVYHTDSSGNVTFPAKVTATSFNGYTIASSVPSGAVFTDTTYTASTASIGSASAGTAIPADDITAWSAGTAASASVANGVLTITNGTAPSLTYSAKSIPNISVTNTDVVVSVVAN